MGDQQSDLHAVEANLAAREMSELLPCPFCGGTASDDGPIWVRCDDITCAAGTVHFKREQWNRRAALAAPEAMPDDALPDSVIDGVINDDDFHLSTAFFRRLCNQAKEANALRGALNEALRHCEFRKDAGQDSAVLSGMVLQIDRCIKRALDRRP